MNVHVLGASRTLQPWWWVSAICFCLLIGGTSLAKAGIPSHHTATKDSPGNPPKARTTITRPLSFFLGGTKIGTLSFADARMDIPVPVAADRIVTQARMRLVLTPSTALNQESWLVVLVNGRVAGQFSLSSGGETIQKTVALSGQFFKVGYNTITLRAAQHYTSRCEYPMASQIWSQVNLAESRLTLNLGDRPWTLRLNDLATLFNPATLHRSAQVLLFYPPSAGAARPGMAAAALAVEGVALRYQYLPVVVHAEAFTANALNRWLAQSHPERRRAIILGSDRELAPLFASAGIQNPPDSGIRIVTWPKHPQHVAVVLIGDGRKLVDLARAFALPEVPWPPLTEAGLAQLRLPERQALLPSRGILPFSSNAFSLKDLGVATQTLSGYDPAPLQVRLWDGGWQRKAQVRLHLTYAAGMSPQSTLNVLVNGIQQGSIPLDDPKGGRYSDYAVTLASTLLHPGWNALTIQPVLVPQGNGGDCRPFFLGNLWVTVYGDSTFQWMGGGLKSTQPDLAPLASKGYPLMRFRSRKPLILQTAQNSGGEISAAMTLLGKLTQAAGRPSLDVKFASGPVPLSQASIYVGSLTGSGRWTKIPGGIQALRSEPFFVGYAAPTHRFWVAGNVPAPLVQGEMRWKGSLHSLAFLRVWRDGGRTHLLFTAADGSALRKAAQELVGYGDWAQLRGTLVWWRISDKRMQSVGLTDEPFRDFGLRGGLSIWVSRHPWLSLLGLVLLGIVFALTTRYGLRRYAQKKRDPSATKH